MTFTYVSPKRPGRVYVRRFDYDEAQRRYDAGESIRTLADAYGVTYESVRRVVTESGRTVRPLQNERAKGAGACDRCGGPMNAHSRISGSRLCRSCASEDLVTTVRADSLRCVTCKEWKPDRAFPHDRQRPHRRGRHNQCTACQTKAKRAYRKRQRERGRVPA